MFLNGVFVGRTIDLPFTNHYPPLLAILCLTPLTTRIFKFTFGYF